MKKYIIAVVVLILATFTNKALAQGPPITGGKPVMLGANTKLVKTLTEIRNTESGTFLSAPLMFHYLPSNNTLLGVHVPYVRYSLGDNESASTLGDVVILGKYQFYRKDQMGKTFRMVLKTLQTLPTGKELFADGISTGNYQNYLGVVAGYETIKYGISNELGYNLVPSSDRDELRYKLGFGLPLLKSAYPVKQINLYFEYQSSYFVELDQYLLLYAQGIQYAFGQTTIEIALQFPLVQNFEASQEREYSIFLGSRYAF